jgi:pyruvate,water dikinase
MRRGAPVQILMALHLELTDPTRGSGEPGRCWTQTNINEATPEVLPPLCWTFWLRGTDIASKQAWFDFGLIPKRRLVTPPTQTSRASTASMAGKRST